MSRYQPLAKSAQHREVAVTSANRVSCLALSACAAAVVLISSCVRTVAPHGAADVVPEDAKICENDDVCVVVDFGCGMEKGYRAAVNQDYVDSVAPSIDSLGLFGTSRDPTCWNSVRTACVAYMCELFLSPELVCSDDDPTCARSYRGPF
jgi:hypothetical protein